MKNPITRIIETERLMMIRSLNLLKSRLNVLHMSSIGVASVAMMFLFLFAFNGCNIVAPLVYIASGPQKTDARYELDTSRTTVIFIDDRFNRAPRRSLRIVAAEAAEQALLTKDALKAENLITTRAIMRVASQEQFSTPKSIAELGRAVGADVVIYAVIDSWTLSSDNITFAPGVSARVKVIDATEDRRLWPPVGVDFPVTASMPPQTIPMPTNAERDSANHTLATMLGAKIAKVFYKHEKDALSGKLDD